MSRRASSGFTLLEVLAVVVLLSAAAGLAIASLAGASEAARLREAAQMVRWADAQARLRARGGTPGVLMLHEDRGGIELRSRRGPLHRARFPTGVSVEIIDAERGTPAGAVAYDRSGRSRDLLVRVRAGDQVRSWEIAGITGFVRAATGDEP